MHRTPAFALETFYLYKFTRLQKPSLYTEAHTDFRIPFWSFHMQRLEASLRTLEELGQLRFPSDFAAQKSQFCDALFAQWSAAPQKIFSLRHYGSSWQLHSRLPRHLPDEICLGLAPQPRSAASLYRAKSQHNLHMLEELALSPFDELLIIDEEGFVTEAYKSNIFLLPSFQPNAEGKLRLITPHANRAPAHQPLLLEGSTRHFLLNAKFAQFDCQQSSIHLSNIFEAEALFICNTVICLKSISRILLPISRIQNIMPEEKLADLLSANSKQNRICLHKQGQQIFAELSYPAASSSQVQVLCREVQEEIARL